MTEYVNRNQRDKRIPLDPIKEQFVANDRIRHPQIRLIDQHGTNVGVMDTSKSLWMARSEGLDLVVISPTASPPVAKICDYNKFIYEQKRQKKESDRKARENAIVTKEIQLRPVIGQHDFDVKLNHAKEWLKDDCKIKIVVKFRGREMTHKELGFSLVNSFLEKLEPCKIERKPEMTSNMIVAMVAPDTQKK